MSRAQNSNAAHGPGAWLRAVWLFYAEGFRSMTIGRKLWALIIVKLILIFLVMRLIFLPNVLSENYDTDAERAQAVRSNLLR